ncbi:unnamed protein product [Nezara viridula]|uniref:Uncharacterized protein n=1 Tax=Nezara viridula TaxID=85310 RepID=A0A9P0GX58_NEZVI|nr:unnamed protein product [Nezara viridula]
MLKARSDESPNGDRPRKKLSFKEPEIMGYYMQMKQNVTSRLSRKGRTSKQKAQDAPPTERYDSSEDPELQVCSVAIEGCLG